MYDYVEARLVPSESGLMTDQMSGKAQEAQVPGLDRGRFPIFSAIVSQ